MSYEQKEIELDAASPASFYSDGLVEAHTTLMARCLASLGFRC
jgi:hypothetical protein